MEGFGTTESGCGYKKVQGSLHDILLLDFLDEEILAIINPGMAEGEML